MSSLRILSFGEILWDRIEGREFLGGAPFNLAAHAVRSGLRADLYSRVGRDDRGRRALAALPGAGIGQDWVQIDENAVTGLVEVSLSGEGEPSYAILPAAWDHIAAPAVEEELKLQACGYEALACGTLAQRSPGSRAALTRLRRLLPEVPVFYDVNLRSPHTPFDLVRDTLPGVTWVKVNEAEAAQLAESLYHTELNPEALFAALSRDFGVQCLLLTRGSQGCLAITRDEKVDSPAPRVKVASTVGAGDALAAVFLAGWLRRMPLAAVLAQAVRVGAWVASCPEAVPVSPPDLFSQKDCLVASSSTPT